ncbi:hypothetical protein GCM10028818_00820 [Spirosoma horti]
MIRVKTLRAVDLEFSSVDLIREKMGQTYITQANGNHGTGIIGTTEVDHFPNSVKYIETNLKRNEAAISIEPLLEARQG